MNKLLLIIYGIAFTLCASSKNEAQYQAIPNGIAFSVQQMDVKVEFYTPTIVRVFKVPSDAPYKKKSLVITAEPDQITFNVEKTDYNVTLKSDSLQVEINLATGGIGFKTLVGKPLLLNTDYGTTFTKRGDMYQVRESFLLDSNEPIYGIGQVLDGKFNHRGTSYHLQNENMFTYSPYFLSPKGYAVYLDNYSISDFLDTPQGLSFTSLGHCDDYYFIYGAQTDKVIAGIRHLTGKTPMLPLWAYGFFQSRERYVTQQESLDVLKKYRALQVPIDCIIQDWRYWPQYNGTDSLWNAQRFDPTNFPNPSKWADEIHKLNAKLMIVTWPGFGAKTPQYQLLDSLNMLIRFHTFPPNSGAMPYDPFSSGARDIFWNYLNKGVFSVVNNDGWWLDSTEPDHIDAKESDFDLPTAAGPYRAVKNLFSYMQNEGIYNHQREIEKDKRVVILTRSGFVGQQRFGSNTWSGDVQSSWESLANQIPAALNLTLMGLPHWNSDIGGFWGGVWNEKGGTKSPEFQQLYTRWMQFALFTPMMRSHGTGLPREIFQFGAPGDWAFDAQKRAINLRYRLLPYIYSTSHEVSENDYTFMRAMFMDFPNDTATYNIGNQYLFGRSLLVSPITKYEAINWSVYLPKGAMWWDFWSNVKSQGGQTLNLPPFKDELPVFVRSGSILPFGPAVQYSTEKKWDNLEIRIYPGADGTFTLYEDENDNYNYENGAYSTIKFTWNEAKQQLQIAQREGSFKGMLSKRTFNIVLVSPAFGAGDKPMPVDKVIKYSGKKQIIKL